MKMEQEQFFALTGKIREEYIAEAAGWKHHGTVQSKASGTVSSDGQMSPADTRAAKRDDRRIRMMAAGGVAVAAAFALTVGAVLHGFGSVPMSPETGMSASEQTEGGYNLYGGKGALRFVGGNPLLLEDDKYYYSPVWEIFRAKKSDADENGAMPMIFDLSKQIVDQNIWFYPGTQFGGNPLYYHADEGKTAIYMRDDNGNECEPLAFQQSIFTDANASVYAARAEVTQLRQLGSTDAYFAELTLWDNADGAASRLCAAILTPEACTVFPDALRSNPSGSWYMTYDDAQERAYCCFLSESGIIEDMRLAALTDEGGVTVTNEVKHPDSVYVHYPYYQQNGCSGSAALIAHNGKFYYYSTDDYCEMDIETGAVREVSIPYHDFTMIGGKLYAVSDGNVIRVNPDGTDEDVVYSGGNAYFVPPQSASDAVVVLTEHANPHFGMVVLRSDGSLLTFYADQDTPPAVTETPAETTLPAETTTEAAAVLPLEQIPPHSNEYPVRTAEEVDAILNQGIEDFKQYGRQPIDTAPYLALFDSVPEGEQAEIAQNYLYHMMLNSVDHFDTAEGNMTYAMTGDLFATDIAFTVDIPEQKSYERTEHLGECISESYVENGIFTKILYNENDPDGIRSETPIPAHAKFTVPDNDRIIIESGSPNSDFITLRRTDLNEELGAGAESLLPQEIAMTHLHDFTQWKITEVGETGGRKNALIEGMYTDLPFEMKVDLETGILLGVWQYDIHHNLTGFIEVHSISVDKP